MKQHYIVGTLFVFLGTGLVFWALSGFLLKLAIAFIGIFLIMRGIKMQNTGTSFQKTFFQFRNF